MELHTSHHTNTTSQKKATKTKIPGTYALVVEVAVEAVLEALLRRDPRHLVRKVQVPVFLVVGGVVWVVGWLVNRFCGGGWLNNEIGVIPRRSLPTHLPGKDEPHREPQGRRKVNAVSHSPALLDGRQVFGGHVHLDDVGAVVPDGQPPVRVHKLSLYVWGWG